ncbi:MAG: hypothetical protein WAV21_03525 [Minisyncoccia bacterium]
MSAEHPPKPVKKEEHVTENTVQEEKTTKPEPSKESGHSSPKGESRSAEEQEKIKGAKERLGIFKSRKKEKTGSHDDPKAEHAGHSHGGHGDEKVLDKAWKATTEKVKSVTAPVLRGALFTSGGGFLTAGSGIIAGAVGLPEGYAVAAFAGKFIILPSIGIGAVFSLPFLIPWILEKMVKRAGGGGGGEKKASSASHGAGSHGGGGGHH